MQLATLDGVGFEGSFVVQVSGDAGTEVIPVSFTHTCVWDCGDGDGVVGINDFLALLADWGNASACDFDGGGVGIDDFLQLLANWGPCP